MLTSQLTTHINAFWDREILPALHDYIRIPNESPLFDPDWQAHGHMATGGGARRGLDSAAADLLAVPWKCCRTATARRCCCWTFRAVFRTRY